MKIKLQELGEGIDEAEVIAVSVKEGDNISADQTLLELETGKAVIEFPSPASGVVKSLLVSEGDKVKVGSVIAELETEEDDKDDAGAEESSDDQVQEDTAGKEPEQEPEEDKTEERERQTDDDSAGREAVEEENGKDESAGKTKSSDKDSRGGGETRKAEKDAGAALSGMTPAKTHIPIAAAPSVRVFAREIGIDIEDVAADTDGRVTIDDVKRYAKKMNKERDVRGATISEPPLPDFSRWGGVDTESMSGVRAAVSAHMTRCWTTIPHVTQHDAADITELDKLRRRFSSRTPEDVKLTLTAILLKIAASALKVFPKFNASIDSRKQEIIYKKYIHIGVAVDTPKGLLVPVIRDVDKKNIIDIATEVSRVATTAREGKLGLEDMKGGSFTLTNLGGIGGSFFTPIINAPEVAILGVGRAHSAPVCGKDELCRPRLMLPLSLSYDHRLIDGADGARFLRWIIEAVEEPLLISLEG